MTRRAAAAEIPGQYGVPITLQQGTIVYPDFTLRLLVHRERARTDGGAPWASDVLEVHDLDHHPTGANIVFTAEHRANARRFEVQGKIYAVEMFSTTTSRDGQDDSRSLPPGEVVVWNEAMASAHNAPLARLWEDRAVDLRSSTLAAYTDGTLIAGFDEDSAIDGSPTSSPFDASFPLGARLVLKKVPRLSPERIAATAATTTAEYATKLRYDRGPLRFPDFILAFVEADEFAQTATHPAERRLFFSAYDPVGGEVRSKFIASRRDRENGFGFDVYRQGFVAELFRTTRGNAMGDDRTVNQLEALGNGELMIWNEASARSSNLRLAQAWQPVSVALLADGREKRGIVLASFANGLVTSRRGSALAILTPAPTGVAELDAGPVPTHTTALPYPAALHNSGYVIRGEGYLHLMENGQVALATFIGDPDEAEVPALQRALSEWTFTPPKKAGTAVAVYVPFTLEYAEESRATPRLVLR